MMYDFLKHYEIPCIIIATKADKIPKGKWQKHLKVTRETLDLDKNDQIILFSSETGQGKDKAWSDITRAICKKITSSALYSQALFFFFIEK